MRPESFPDPKRTALRAAIFASDLRARSEDVLEAFAARRTSGEVAGVACDMVRLPITIPRDEQGLVLLGPATLDCDKTAAIMEVVRPRAPSSAYRLGIGLANVDGSPLLIPGVNGTGADTDPPLAVHELTFAVADAGFAVVGFGPQGNRLDLALSENTACLLATALLIALGVKLVKAERGGY